MGKKFRKAVNLLLTLLLSGFFLLPVPAGGESSPLRIDAPEGTIHPGLVMVFRYYLPEEGPCSLVLRGEDDIPVSVISEGHYAYAGENTIYWNGTYQGQFAPEGVWRLCLEKDGESAEVPVTIGAPAPVLMGVTAETSAPQGGIAGISYYATAPGDLELSRANGDEAEILARMETDAGDGEMKFPVDLVPGRYELLLSLTGGEGIRSETVRVALTVNAETRTPEPPEDPELETAALAPETSEKPAAAAETVFTPSMRTSDPTGSLTPDYWTTPMDIADEAAVWKALTAPMTVINNGKTEKAQIVLREEPSAESRGVGTVTCMTQGVHVLEKGEEWSLVECYSSSFHDSPILNWNALVQGYVPTRYLEEVIPDQELGYVIDKLTQRLYVFVEGHLYSTLVVSTGLSNARQPYNETRSGEFLMTSKVGTFSSDNLRCGMAIRFNKGDLLHEVPHTLLQDGSRNYKDCEAKLGTRASHGCIRVQRKATAEGVNMAWIWKNHRKNTRLMIWEDWQGRQMPLPAEDLQLYYNPKGGAYYHSQDHCSSVTRKDIVFEPFSWGELENAPYAKLKWCEYCAPALRRAQIEQINADHAPGGDHDPVLTEARKNCPRPLK